MCLDLGTNATINSSIVSSAANLAIGGTNFKAGLLPGFSADDGNAANIYFGNTGNTLIPNGSVGIGTVSPTGALEIEGGNVGIGTWTTGGGQLIVSTRNGNVGIGSSAPGQALDVNGTVRTTGFTLNLNPNAGFVLVGNGVGVGTWMPASTLTAGGGTNYWLNDTTGNVGISTAYAVGIGTTFVGGTGEAALSVMNGNVGIGTWVPGGALVVMGGNVGIGTAVPQFPLDAVNTSNTQLIRLRDDLGDYVGFGTQGNLNNFAFLGGTNLNLAATIETAGIFVGGTYFVPPSNDVIVATGGNVGIGTGSTPVSQLNVNGGVSIGTTSTNLAYISGNAAPSGGLIVQGNVGIGTFNPFDGNLIVNGGGNVGIGSLAPGTALDVNGTARMTGFTLTGNGAAAGNIMVSSAVGVGTWMSTTTLPVGSLTVETPGDVTYYSTTNSLAGGSGFQTNGTNVGIGTSNFTNASLQIVGNIGIGTVANGDKFIMSLPTNGGMIIEGNVGIGTWAPTKSLSITGDTYHNGNIGIGTSITNVSALSVMNGNVGIGTWAPSDTFQVGKFSSSSSGFEIDINGNVGMGTTITSNASLSVMNGNVGIGTWVPSQSVSVNGAINTLGNTSNSYLNSTGGNVGIGSTNPGQTLDVNGRVRSVGIGTTVPEPACLKADGTIGYYSTPTWQGVCS
jgi:hypothetical protein